MPATPLLVPTLTSLSHGGGCGCKISPEILSRILKKTPGLPLPKELLVGIETSDDAAVYQINEHQAIIATTDFFTPIVDDPFDFGRIAATNAISDVYAMGGTPIFALAIVGMPLAQLPESTISQILAGGEAICKEAGIPIAGGHSIDTVEPIYGLVVLGLIDPSQLKRNSGAKPSDVLILGKPLGVGILSAALKSQVLDTEGYAELITNTTRLNTPGQKLAREAHVHAMTDVTGFGLLGHTLEMCCGAGLGATLYTSKIPVIEGCLLRAAQGQVTGASKRNWESYGNEVDLTPDFDSAWRAVLTDPQTSGGLLVACAAESAQTVVKLFESSGFPKAAMIGRMTSGPSRVSVVDVA